MSRRMTFAVLIAAATTTLWARPATAQESGHQEQVQHRNRCRLAAQAMQTGRPHPHYQWARGYISICDDEGPHALASEWRTVREDTAEVYFLIRSSSRIRDARIFEALQQAATDRSRPDVVRVGAMITLSRYVDPQNAIGFPDVRPPRGGVNRIPLVSNWTTGGGQSQGSVALQAPAAPRVKAILQEIAAARDVESTEIWYAAAVLAKRVERDMKNGRAR